MSEDVPNDRRCSEWQGIFPRGEAYCCEYRESHLSLRLQLLDFRTTFPIFVGNATFPTSHSTTTSPRLCFSDHTWSLCEYLSLFPRNFLCELPHSYHHEPSQRLVTITSSTPLNQEKSLPHRTRHHHHNRTLDQSFRHCRETYTGHQGSTPNNSRKRRNKHAISGVGGC